MFRQTRLGASPITWLMTATVLSLVTFGGVGWAQTSSVASTPGAGRADDMLFLLFPFGLIILSLFGIGILLHRAFSMRE